MILDGDIGDLLRCDWCGKVMDFTHAPSCPAARIRGRWEDCLCGANKRYDDEAQGLFDGYRASWLALFVAPDTGRPIGGRMALGEDFPEDLCRECAVALSPIVHRFAEIAAINYFNNKLERTINGRRKENRRAANDGPTADVAGECLQGHHAG